MSNVVFLRRQGLGLESIRNIMGAMDTSARIARVDIRTQPVPTGRAGSKAINWGTMALPSHYKVFNTPSAIAKSSSKGHFRKKLFLEGLAPYTAVNTTNIPDLAFPVVIRPMNHFGGNDLAVAYNKSELISLSSKAQYSGGFYVSTYIAKKAEFRVFVVSGRVVYVVNKIPGDATEVAWNVHQGGRFENIRFGLWPIDVVKSALHAMKLSELDFGAVDVMVDFDNAVYVLEVNSAPALSSEYWYTCVAKAFDYMLVNPEQISSNLGSTKWRDFIHPAISDEAIMPSGDGTDSTPEIEYTLNVEKSIVGLPTPTNSLTLSDYSVDESHTYYVSNDHRVTFVFSLDREVRNENTRTVTKYYVANIIKQEKLEWVAQDSEEAEYA